MDRVVSCSPTRALTIEDKDCMLCLPRDSINIAGDAYSQERMTLAQLFADLDKQCIIGYSAFLCLTASTLGRIERYYLRRRDDACQFLPWRSHCEWSSIQSTLLACESYSPQGFIDFNVVLDRQNIPGASKHTHILIMGQFCFSHALYFLNQCLLNHPFLLRCWLRSSTGPCPPSFLRQTFMACYENAANLTRLLQTLMKRRICLASFLGQCALVAGVIHRLFQFSGEPLLRDSACTLYNSTLEFLHQAPGRWRHFPRLVSILLTSVLVV